MAKSEQKGDVIVGDAEGKNAIDQAKDARKKNEKKDGEKSIKDRPVSETMVPHHGHFKVGEQVISKKYQGDLTASSVHADTGEKISIRMHIPTPVTEEGVWNRFQAHYGNVALRDHFEIDPENVTDPMLRTSLGG